MSGEDLPTFDVVYYGEDLQLRVYLIHNPKTKNEHRELLRIFPAPDGPKDWNAAESITDLIINFKERRGN